MEFFKVDLKDAILVHGATSGLGLTDEAEQFTILQIEGITTDLDSKTITLIITQNNLNSFIRVVQAMENA